MSLSPEAWAFLGVLVTQAVTYLLGRRDTRRVDSTHQVQQLADDLAKVQGDVSAVRGDVREVVTDLRNVKGWVGSIDRRLTTRRRLL